jgi:hypothetical protein
MSNAPTHALAGLARQRRRLLESMAAVGERQQQLLDDADTTPLLHLLSAKQQLIGALAQVERQLDPFRTEDPASRVWDSEQQRQACADDLRIGSQLLGVVLERERNHTECVTARRDAVARQLAVANTAHAAASAYQPHTQMTGSAIGADAIGFSAPLDLTAGA